MAVIAVDLDGTLIEKSWPALGSWLPGAAQAMRTLLDSGHRVYVYSARLSPMAMDGSEKSPADVFRLTAEVRKLLDDAGLPDMGIWEGSGKPFFHVLVDDRAMWFPGRPRSWSRILPKLLMRAGDQRAADIVLHGEDTE